MKMEAEKEEKEVVEKMLEMLYQCLFISVSNRRFKETRTIISDIKIVKTELRRIRLKQALGDSIKEK